MRIGFDANAMVGELDGVGWHSYHLLRTMLAQQEGIDFAAYAKPGAEQPDFVKAWPGGERLQWINSNRLEWESAVRAIDWISTMGPTVECRLSGVMAGS
jgi:hypothetical protein